jgi:acetolactate synthase-1/2/3 large subunit
VVVGDRLSEMTTNHYTLPGPAQTMIQVEIDPAVIGRNVAPALAVVSDARLALEAALEQPAPAADGRRGPWIASIRSRYEAYVEPQERPAQGASAERVMKVLQQTLPEDAVLTTDAGNFSAWVQRYYHYRTEDSFLGPIVGSMGYGVPSAIAAKLAHPQRVVVGTCGDGGFLMTAQELATAVQYKVNIIQLVFNNGLLGTIRMHQEREFPGRALATDLVNPDFAAMARAYGAEGHTVRTSEEFLPALQAALGAGKPVVIDIRTDPENLSVSATLSDLRSGRLPRKSAAAAKR